MTEKQRRYKFGDYILRERKGRYYVYKLENVNGEVKERYVGPLTNVVETYEKLKNSIGGVGVPPTTDPPGFEPGTIGSEGLRSVLAELRVLTRNNYLVEYLDSMEDPKAIVARHALKYIGDAKLVGLGTGRTVRKLIEVLQETGLLNGKKVVASSLDTELLIAKAFPDSVLSLVSGSIPDVYFDSFDQLVKGGNSWTLVKGGGGALLREKVLSYSSRRRVFLGEKSKLWEGRTIKVPIEVVPVALSYVLRGLENMKVVAEVREGTGKIGPVLTDNGNVVMDVVVETKDLCHLDKRLKSIPGVIETGVFCEELYDVIILGDPTGNVEIVEKSRS